MKIVRLNCSACISVKRRMKRSFTTYRVVIGVNLGIARMASVENQGTRSTRYVVVSRSRRLSYERILLEGAR